MKQRPVGNGTGKVNIQLADLGGWVRVFPESERMADDFPGDLALVLGKSLNSWLQENPRVRVQFAFPITRNGRTYELYAWYQKAPAAEAPASSIELADYQLADADMTAFELELKRLGGSLDGVVQTWVSPTGVTYHRLTQCRVLVGKGEAPQIEALCSAHGFHPKRPAN